MIQIGQSHVNMNVVIVDLKTPISALVTDRYTLSNHFINLRIKFSDKVLGLRDNFDKILQLCGSPTPFPTIGQLFNLVKMVIEKMRIGSADKKVVGDADGIGIWHFQVFEQSVSKPSLYHRSALESKAS